MLLQMHHLKAEPVILQMQISNPAVDFLLTLVRCIVVAARTKNRLLKHE